MAAKSRNSNGSPSNDDEMEETPAENAVRNLAENGQAIISNYGQAERLKTK